MSNQAFINTVLYPPIEPYRTEYLKVSDIHELYLEQSGNPNGVPVVFLHGGPGAGCASYHRQFFDPTRYRIILFDQRGAGRSKPYADLRDNTTWDLVSDIEKIRNHLNIDKWHVFGGSWGSTLALAYGETHPERCRSLMLRGIFLLRKKEIDWFYQEGASMVFPDYWESYVKPIPPESRKDFVSSYYKILTGTDRQKMIEAAKAWSIWEGSTCTLMPSDQVASQHGEDKFAEAFARIECHYFINKGFLKSDDQLIRDASKLKNIPVAIVHGRYDMVCPIDNAWALYRAIPHAELHIIADAGHAVTEPGITKKLREITDRFVLKS